MFKSFAQRFKLLAKRKNWRCRWEWNTNALDNCSSWY